MSDDQDTTAPGRVNITVKPLAPRITVRRGDYSTPDEAQCLIRVLMATGWHIIEVTTDGGMSSDHVPAKTILEFGYRAIQGSNR